MQMSLAVIPQQAAILTQLAHSFLSQDRPLFLTTHYQLRMVLLPAKVKPLIRKIPIALRDPLKDASRIRGIIFNLYFFSVAICLHVVQVLALPLLVVPIYGKNLFNGVNLRVKEGAGGLLASLSQLYAPTKLVLTFEGELDKELLERIHQGDLSGLYPRQNVTISNHQIYSDWVYIWNLLYAASLHGSIMILLKKSLAWVPIIGPGLQLFNFIFMVQSWKLDKDLLEKEMKRASPKEPISLLVFPEGTLVSKLTRPKSASHAIKMSKQDHRNLLLPRSTGLLFCLRALRERMPDCHLVDLTIGYEGIPADSYGQDFYTLQSTFAKQQQPPNVHIHYRSVPLSYLPLGHSAKSIAEEATAEEKALFEDWLEERWLAKDRLLDHFYATGSFTGGENTSKTPGVHVQIALRSADAVKFGAIVAIGGAALYLGLRSLIRWIW